MFGEDGEPSVPNKDAAVQIARAACRTDLVSDMVNCVGVLEFEARKDLVAVFDAIVRVDEPDGDKPGCEYVLEHQDVLSALFDGYDDPEVALPCGRMFRECVRDESIARLVLESTLFDELFDKLDVPSFEVASDAFSTFKDLLTRHKALVAGFLSANYDAFFAAYGKILVSPNYVTRRQSLRLLGELLLDRSNVKVMVQYVADPANLVLMMNLLKDPSRSIQFEAFHVFKVFVANPNKTPPIVEILANNRDKLLKYLSDFHEDRDDEQFKEERDVIIKEIALLPTPSKATEGTTRTRSSAEDGMQ